MQWNAPRPEHLLTALLAATLLVPLAHAGPPHEHAFDTATARRIANDPFAPVYIVSSAESYRQRVSPFAASARSVHGSTGSHLVIARVPAHEVPAISHRIHVEEKRCGGFFAFPTLAAAQQFVQSGRSARAIETTFADYTIDNQATVEPWLPQVSAANIRDTIDHLSNGYANRYYASSHGYDSALWIRDRWLSLAGGRSDVGVELFDCSSCGGQPSVILTIEGAELPDEVVVLGGHLDSISSAGSGDAMDAPGADDDASGIATLTEVIRVALADGWQPRRTVKFMGYAAEEVGLRGSNAIAQSFADQGVDVVGVLQLDMTNYAAGASVDMRLLSDYSNADLQQFSRDLFDEYLAPLGRTRGTYTCGYGCSDHASWTNAGYPAVMMFEATFNNDIHTPYDTLANMGNTAQASVPLAQFGLAFVGELAKTAGGGAPGNQTPVAGFSASVDGLVVSFTDSSSDADGTVVSRQWKFGDDSTSTETHPAHAYDTAGIYTVSLSITDDDGATDTLTRRITVNGDGNPGGNELQPGVPVDGLSAASGDDVRYTMVVPEGASNLSFTISGGSGSGDADLYVQHGSAPTDASYDCRPYRWGNAETCTFANPQAGTWHVRVDAYQSFSGVSLVGDYDADGGGGDEPQTYGNTTDYPIRDRATVESPIDVSGRSGNAPSDAQVYIDVRHTYIGDLRIDLVAPDGSTYNLHNRSGGSANDVVGTATLDLGSESLNGTWKLRVNDAYRYDTGRINEWRITF